MNGEGREVPIGIGPHYVGCRFVTLGKLDQDGARRIAHDVPVGHDQAELAAGVDQRATAVGNGVLLGHGDAGDRRVRLLWQSPDQWSG